jgi:GWxTD domain-containing protein
MKDLPMRKAAGIWLAAALVVLAPALDGQTARSSKDLPPRYRAWLEEDVVYVITPKEKDVFLQLATDRERERFIEAFWRQRDPDPATPENEYRKEHERRIAFANQRFGRDEPGLGWRTPMGRIYITLGEPKQIERFESTTGLRPIDIWFYDGMAELGLPNAFYVVFYQRNNAGGWTLYSPIANGPGDLMVDSASDPADPYAAFQELAAIEPSVASVSLSLIPGESSNLTSPSMASEILLQTKIPAAPWERVKDLYAEKFLKYKDSVGVEYTANYVDSDFALHVFRDPSGVAFVHYLLEPSKLTLERRGDRYMTTLEINLIVSDDRGRAIHQAERTLPIDFSAAQFEAVKAKLFSLQDLFPLVEGTYSLSVLVRNVMSKEFTSAEAKVTVTPPGGPEIGPLVLANRTVENSSYRGTSKPYLFGARQLVTSPRSDFGKNDTLYLFCQLLGLNDALRRTGSARVAVSDDHKAVWEARHPLAEIAGLPDLFEPVPLGSLPPAFYSVRVEVLDGRGTVAASREAGFALSFAEALPRPFVVSFPSPPAGDPVYENILGNELLALGSLAQAGPRLEKAFRAEPGALKYALDYGRWLFASGDLAGLRRLGEPLLRDKGWHELAGLLGQAAEGQGDYEAALAFYRDYLGHFGAVINVMNSVGDCHLKLGRADEALAMWKKSLELSPDQDRIKKLVESLEKK